MNSIQQSYYWQINPHCLLAFLHLHPPMDSLPVGLACRLFQILVFGQHQWRNALAIPNPDENHGKPWENGSFIGFNGILWVIIW